MNVLALGVKWLVEENLTVVYHTLTLNFDPRYHNNSTRVVKEQRIIHHIIVTWNLDKLEAEIFDLN